MAKLDFYFDNDRIMIARILAVYFTVYDFIGRNFTVFVRQKAVVQATITLSTIIAIFLFLVIVVSVLVFLRRTAVFLNMVI